MSINVNGVCYKLALQPSKQDHRTFKLSLEDHQKDIDLPSAFALIDIDKINVYDQGSLGSCTSNAVGQAIRIKTQNKLSISRLYQYLNSRLLEGTISEDSGCSILDALKALKKYYYVDESIYPYDISKFAQIPDKSIYLEAYKNKPIDKYESIQQDAYHLKYVLSVYKQPVICGISVFSSFNNLDCDYICPIPNPSTDQFLGNHCVLIIGYDSQNNYIMCNSWSNKWGNNGCCKLPSAYILNPNLSSEFYTVSLGF